MNNANIFGRLTKDPDIRYTQSGKAVASFTVAVNRIHKNADGSSEADFINCVAWSNTADYLENFAKKGMQCAVSGRIQTRNYDDRDGKKVWVTEIVANDVNLVFPPKESSTRVESDYGEVRYGTPQKNSSVGSYGRNLDVSDVQGDLITSDDLPF